MPSVAKLQKIKLENCKTPDDLAKLKKSSIFSIMPDWQLDRLKLKPSRAK